MRSHNWFHLTLLFVSFSFSSLARAVDFEKVHFKSGDRIGLYRGSFDPIHLGHDQLIRYAFEYAKLDYVLLIPGQISLKKPQRTLYEIRAKMISDIYQHDPKVVINTKGYGMAPLEKVIDEISKGIPDLKFVGIIGSDNVIDDEAKPSKPSKPGPIEAWAISPRAPEDAEKIPKTFRDRPVIQLPIDERKISSTRIKKYLYSHPEFFAGYPAPSEEVALHPEAIEFIQKNNLYRNPPGKMGPKECVMFLKALIRTWRSSP